MIIDADRESLARAQAGRFSGGDACLSPTHVFIDPQSYVGFGASTCQARAPWREYALLWAAATEVPTEAIVSYGRVCISDVWSAPSLRQSRIRWKILACENADDLTLRQVQELIRELNHVLEHAGPTVFLAELDDLEFRSMSKDAIVAVLRTLFSSRTWLRNWSEIVDRAATSLEERGKSAQSIRALA
jgi:hypothetical protein